MKKVDFMMKSAMTEQQQNDRLTRMEAGIKSLGKSFDQHRVEMLKHIQEADNDRSSLMELKADFKSLKFGTKIVLRIAATLPFILGAMWAATQWLVGIENKTPGG